MTVSDLDLRTAAFLDKIKKLYPYGIPTSYISTPALEPQSDSKFVCSFVVVLPDGVALDEGRLGLLEGICTKGLKRAFKECQVIQVKDSREALAGNDAIKTPVIVVFGADAEAGRFEKRDELGILYTYSLDRIAQNVGIKREFWKQLQENILPRIVEG
jgi:hypothetical protein